MRGSLLLPVCLVLLVALSTQTIKVNHHQSEDYGNSIRVIKSERSVILNGAYPEQTNKVTLTNTGQESVKTFYHIIPADIYSNLVDIKFEVKRILQKHSIKETGDGAAIVEVTLLEPLTSDNDKVVTIFSRYIHRYRNLPREIAVLEDQMLQYGDYANYYSPYSVDLQWSSYKFQRLLQFSKGGEKEGITTVKFTSVGLKPFNNTKISVHGVNNEPQILISKVERVVEVSHWGNIAITEKYGLYNVGPKIKGEFSRVEYNPYNEAAGRNSFKQTGATLPYESWGLYFKDEVGNISTSKAYRDVHRDIIEERAKLVRVDFTPRYGLLGGWKCNWEIGYNLPLKGFLFHDNDNFELRNVSFGYDLERIVAEKFTFSIILPEGATDYKIFLNDEEIAFEESKSFWFLDYSGKPTLTVNRGITSKAQHRGIKVTYKFSRRSILKKPFIVFAAFFTFFLVLIFAKRVHLKTLESDHQHTH